MNLSSHDQPTTLMLSEDAGVIMRTDTDGGVWDRKCRMISVFLVAAVLVLYAPTLGYGFVNYDDDSYVYANDVVSRGLSLKGMAWALVHPQYSDWVPLTAWSHMLAITLFDHWAGGHHLLNVLLHAANSVLLFAALRTLTNATWRSAWVAAFFALHPLRVESVAWVTERKDVLSGLFFMLMLLAYARYVRQPSRKRMIVVAALLALGLMSKAMLITTPFVLLLLDVWPLKRWGRVPLRQLLTEKIRLFGLVVGALVIGVLVNHSSRTITSTFPLSLRIETSVVSYGVYLKDLLWPTGLAIVYPYPTDGLPWGEVAAAVMVLAGLTVLAVAVRRRMPWVLMGWLWYVGMLVPVIGLMMPGQFVRADRYTYLSEIGVCIAIVWSVAAWCATKPWALRWACGAGVLSLLGSAVATTCQLPSWKNSAALWERSLACTSHNAIALENYCATLLAEKRPEDVIRLAEPAVREFPKRSLLHSKLGFAYRKVGRDDDAVREFRAAVQLKPNDAETRVDLAVEYLHKGLMSDALEQYKAAQALEPNNEAWKSLCARLQVLTEHRSAPEAQAR